MQEQLAQDEQRITELKKSLEQQQAIVQEMSDRQREQLALAESKIKETDVALQELNRAARSSSTDTSVQLERLIKEFQELRGDVELVQFRIAQVEGKIDGEGSVTARLDALEKKPALAPAETPATYPTGKAELISFAGKLVQDGKTAEARGVLREVLKRWPDELGISDEAHYQLAELYFGEGKFRGALDEYVNVVERFKDGKRIDDAFFRIGECSLKLGNPADAQIFFSEIIKNYRSSPYYSQASQKVKEITKLLAEAKAPPKKK